MACNSKMVGLGAKGIEIWDTVTLVTQILCTQFDLVVFTVILESNGVTVGTD